MTCNLAAEATLVLCVQDVLHGKGDSKAQLKEILGLLNAPKRPSPLDKPAITATAGRKTAVGTAPDLRGAPGPQLAVDPDKLLGLIDAEQEPSNSRCESSITGV